MKKVVNWLTHDWSSHKGEVNTMKSVTVPNEALSIQTILDRWSRGMPLPQLAVPVYSNTTDFDSIDLSKVAHMDLVERDELKKMLTFRISELTKKHDDINRIAKEQTEAAEKAAFQKRFLEQDAAKASKATATKKSAGVKNGGTE